MGKRLQILNESVEQNKVIDAIKKRYEVKLTYRADDDPKGTGQRLIQPVAYGLSKTGNPVFRAFQPLGDTKTKVPHWKLFRLDRVEGWAPLKKRKFSEPPNFPYTTAEGKFNPNGDKSMSEVYIIANFTGAQQRYERGGLKKYNELVQQQKMEQDPLYKLKKNVQKSVKLSPDEMKRVADWGKNKPKEIQDYLNGTTAKEMASVQNFGDTNVQLTTGPVTKQNMPVTKTQQQIKPEAYRKLMANGPATKEKEQLAQDDMETAENTPETEENKNIIDKTTNNENEQ